MTKKVYLIRAAQFYKIGISSDFKKRLPSIQTGCPIKCEYIGTIPHPDPVSLERELHLRFQDFKTFGEWFDLGDDNIKILMAEYGLKHVKNPLPEPTQKSITASSNKSLVSARNLSAEVNEVDALFGEFYPGRCLSGTGKLTIRKLITAYGVDSVSESLRHLSSKFGEDDVFKNLKSCCKTYHKYGRHISDKLWYLYWKLKSKIGVQNASSVLSHFMDNDLDNNESLIDFVAYHSRDYFRDCGKTVWNCIEVYLND